jgi:hypothetical protein
MGTRHLIKVIYNKETKVAQYGQWDGYPDGQGITIIKFFDEEGNIDKLKNKLSSVRFCDEKKDKAFVDGVESEMDYWRHRGELHKTTNQIWFETFNSRNIGAEILNNIVESEMDDIILFDESDFIEEPLFCEWAYIINLDINEICIHHSGEVDGPFDIVDLQDFAQYIDEYTERDGE